MYDDPQRACLPVRVRTQTGEVKRRIERGSQDCLRFAMNSHYDFLALGAWGGEHPKSKRVEQ
ncbi:hypothetical protein [Nitrosococcus oceani]|uniref:Uncharacterized protein n=1 Tax=Nitrosococcus oceani C-27 TaxID=314279 RepID=A0A0E2Z9F7_9GAMM|nr:hypothetical protein [Nitrosococcus oceani]KFI20350.1 hypothetical protein IB75_04340 [Nitrosococcus oceani C-27]GEM20249.1 hypothetical protein NONS58_16590 [Nitrosococcus oceani]